MSENKKKFINEAKPKQPEEWERNGYGFTRAPELMFLWSRLLQAVVSQVATYKFTKKFHERDCGIYKCEGGCVVDRVGDLVLGTRGCRFDYADGKEMDKKAKQCSDI